MIGPVQLLVVGFEEPNFQGEVLAELQSLKENDVVRVIDILVANKDAAGEVETLQISDLSTDEAQEFGEVVKALIGLGEIAGGDAEGAARMWSGDEGTGLTEEDLLDVLAEIPRHRGGDRPAGAPLGDPDARGDRAGRRLPDPRLVGAPARPRRGRPARGRRGRADPQLSPRATLIPGG